jgi:hypothetical protein
MNYVRDILEDIANESSMRPEVSALLGEFFTILGKEFDYKLEAKNKDIEANVHSTPSLRSYQVAALSSGLNNQLQSIFNEVTDSKSRGQSFGHKQHEIDATESNIQCALWETRLWKKDIDRHDLRSYNNITVQQNSSELEQYRLSQDATVDNLIELGKRCVHEFLPTFTSGEERTFPLLVQLLS